MQTEASKVATRVVVSTHAIAGHFAMWAVRQSPYGYPDDLPVALTALRQALTTHFQQRDDCVLDMVSLSRQELYQLLKAVIFVIPTCQAWNRCKANPGAEFVFTSAFSKNHPDHDLIDLYALAMNVAKTVWNECYES